jgi:hypothetical protein
VVTAVRSYPRIESFPFASCIPNQKWDKAIMPKTMKVEAIIAV